MTLALETRPPRVHPALRPGGRPSRGLQMSSAPRRRVKPRAPRPASDRRPAVRSSVNSTPARDLQGWILLAFSFLLGAAFVAAVW